MAIKAIISDLGGVILRTDDTTPIDQFAATLGLTRKELERKVYGGPSAHRANIGEIDELEQWRLVLSDLGMPFEKLPDLIDPFYKSARFDTGLLIFFG